MRVMKILAGLVMLLLLGWMVIGCSNPDNVVKPPLPNTGDNDQQSNPDPTIPTPFAGVTFGEIFDIVFEKDGDPVISDPSNGIRLFDTFGVFKRTMDPGSSWFGMVDVGPGWLDNGKAVIATGEQVPAGPCAWATFYDDQYVTGGGSFGDPATWWWGGTVNPTIVPSITATSGTFECPTITTPMGIDLHPIYGWLFIEIGHRKVHIDPLLEIDPDQIPENFDLRDGIMAMNPFAPQLGFRPDLYEGPDDYVVYHDKSDVDTIDQYGYPMASDAVQIFCWDETAGCERGLPGSGLPPRNGITTTNVADFEFDAYGRMIVVLPNGNSFAITDPVIPPTMIVTQRIIGGAQDGTSHAPGDFYGPRGVAVDPRNQDIYITDTALNRVQVFDNNGKFIRMFGTGMSTGLDLSSPSAIEVDSLGNVYISVAGATLDTGALVVVNEFGAPISYGSIEGYVRDKTTSVTLDNVIVSIASTYRQFITVTDEQGHFKFSSVPQGIHTLLANRAGYKAGNVGVTVTGGNKTTVTLYLERTGVGKSGYGDITGKVMSSLDGDPLGGLLVSIKGLGITDTTTDEGTFHLYTVPEGDHVMQILSNSIVLYEQDVHVNSDVITPLGYIYLPL